MQIITIYYDTDAQETRIYTSKAFDRLPELEKADILSDIIQDCMIRYRVEIKKFALAHQTLQKQLLKP